MTAPEVSAEPAGCGTALAILFTFVGFSIAAAWIGIAQTNFWLYFAGLPASGIFALFGSELILAWPLDAILWISAAWMIASRTRPPKSIQLVAIVIGAALLYGFALSRLVEPTGSIL